MLGAAWFGSVLCGCKSGVPSLRPVDLNLHLNAKKIWFRNSTVPKNESNGILVPNERGAVAGLSGHFQEPN